MWIILIALAALLVRSLIRSGQLDISLWQRPAQRSEVPEERRVLSGVAGVFLWLFVWLSSGLTTPYALVLSSWFSGFYRHQDGYYSTADSMVLVGAGFLFGIGAATLAVRLAHLRHRFLPRAYAITCLWNIVIMGLVFHLGDPYRGWPLLRKLSEIPAFFFYIFSPYYLFFSILSLFLNPLRAIVHLVSVSGPVFLLTMFLCIAYLWDASRK